MRFFRNAFLLLTVFVFVLSTGCTANNDKDDTLDIVCTIFPQYDFARAVAGDVSGVNIKMLLGSGQESHDYDPSSKDIAAIHNCDIFVYTGGESDSWIRDMLESVNTEDKTVISLMEVVDVPLKQEIAEGMETEDDDHDHGAIDHVEYDEHVWTSLVNASMFTDVICEAMCRHMPEAADSFRENSMAYCEKISELDGRFKELAESVSDPTIVVADRFPLLYFCRDYGIKYYAAFSGCAASTEPSSKTVQFLIEKIKEKGIPAVIKMDLSSGNVADTVAEATGADIVTFNSCHTLSTEDFDAGETYLSMMQKNYDSLSVVLGVS